MRLKSAINIYREALGAEAFDRLPHIVQRAHEEPLRAAGAADVQSGRGLGRLLAVLTGMPQPGRQVPLAIEVTQEGTWLLWNRRFGSQRFLTRQRYRDGFVLEKAGASVLWLQLTAQGAVVHYKTVRVTFLGLPLPKLLRPTVTATVRENGDGWLVDVSVTHPLAGLLCAYQGELRVL